MVSKDVLISDVLNGMEEEIASYRELIEHTTQLYNSVNDLVPGQLYKLHTKVVKDLQLLIIYRKFKISDCSDKALQMCYDKVASNILVLIGEDSWSLKNINSIESVSVDELPLYINWHTTDHYSRLLLK